MLASPTVAPTPVLPERPPFSLRARLLTPLADGGSRHEADGLLVVDADGRIALCRRRGGSSGGSRVGAGAPRLGAAPGAGRPPRPPATAAERRPGSRPGPADLAGALHLSAGTRVRRGPGRRRGTGRLAGLRGRRHDDGTRLRRGVRGQPRRHVPGCRGARHPRGRRQGDDGPGHVRPDHRPGDDPRSVPARSRRPLFALAHARRRAAAVRVHATVRGLVQRRHAPRIGGARPRHRCVLADPRVRGPRRDRRGGAALPGGDRLRRRVRPGRRARGADGAGPRRAPVRAGDRTARRDRHAGGALPGVEPVPRLRRDAAGALSRGRDAGRPRVRRGRRARPVDLRRDAGRVLLVERAAR